MIATVRKEIDDQWVEAYLEMKHPTTVKTKSILVQYTRSIPVLPPTEFKAALDKAVTPEDASAIDDVIILGQIKAWSFGEVTKDVLDNEVSEDKRNKILAILGDLYSPLVSTGSGSSLETCTPIS